ncbi:triose-phosphate isomerase [Niveispirillum sp.]|uniref:triose-phosphate isomerase n=1 Tax=Niveispirillum sp. TaxID=1917217 RepID=UPI001B60BEB6|nr:triose-phosphate isomerase [Niveispirillum sp.]MBP7334905.1 triose-phosphate isomerase [Niveispirillum sp.]
MNVPFIAGNWKMNGLRADGLALARDLADWLATARPGLEMLICPPATLLADIAAMAAGGPLLVGAQDCHHRPAGAHTGDLSAAMLADAGAGHVILGHSERRARGEDSALIAAKAAAALSAGLRPLICIGETLAEREVGQAGSIVTGQLRDSLPPGIAADRLIIAYEPVWAIGTGRTADADTIAAMHALIKAELSALLPGGDAVRLLYGGSVTPANAATILHLPGVDGVLVGGASLKAADFKAIALGGRGGA